MESLEQLMNLSPEEQRARANSIFTAQRTKMEMQLRQWTDKAMQLDEVEKEKLEAAIGMSVTDIEARKLFGELYQDSPNPEVYHKQFLAWKETEAKINEYVQLHDEEGKKCLSEYIQLASSKA